MVFLFVSGCAILLTSCKKDSNALVTGSFIDSRDQHQYQWVTIGTQTWMSENLAWLPAVNPPLNGSDSAPFYYVFRYEGTSVTRAREWDYFSTYGVFYNWPAAMDGALSSDHVPSGIRAVCPEGWHLPSDGEWDVLVSYLGDQYSAGITMKSTKGWNPFEGEPGNGDNSSGFDALPCGSRQSGGEFYNLGFNAIYWSSSGYDEFSAWNRYLGYNHKGVNRYFFNKRYGFSVRCVRDN
jgi:uncharacterized protein (TIGR02145 family)